MKTPFSRKTQADTQIETQLSSGEETLGDVRNGEQDSAVLPKDDIGLSSSAIAEKTSREGSGLGASQKLPMKKMLSMPKLPGVNFSSMYRTVTLSVEKDVVRVVVFRGKKITSWGTAPLSWAPGELEAAGHPEPEIEKPPLHGLLEDLGVRTGGSRRGLLNQAGIRRGRVVMDFSLYTTLMRHLQVPKVTGRYLEPMVVSEILEAIPFDKKEVDISWHLVKSQDDPSVFAVTLPKNRVDSQVRLLRDSGLIPAAAYSKANVLALAAGVPDALVVHLEPTQAAIVLVSAGEPQVVHQVDLAEATSGPEEQGEAIARAVDQVAGYHQSFDPRVRNAQLPVILTGENSAESNPVVQILKQNLECEVRPFVSPIECPAGFPIEQYATNIGLLLADRGQPQRRENEQNQKAPALDLLPKRHQPIPLPTFQTAVFVILFLLALHPFDLTEWVQDQKHQTAAITLDLGNLKRQEKKHDVVLANHQQSQSGYDLAQEETFELENRMAEWRESLDTLLYRLDIITQQSKPETVSLIAVSPSDLDFVVMGGARSYSEALRYAANLRSYDVFEDARMVQIQGADGGEADELSFVSFQIKVTVPVEDEAEGELVDGPK